MKLSDENLLQTQFDQCHTPNQHLPSTGWRDEQKRKIQLATHQLEAAKTMEKAAAQKALCMFVHGAQHAQLKYPCTIDMEVAPAKIPSSLVVNSFGNISG